MLKVIGKCYSCPLFKVLKNKGNVDIPSHTEILKPMKNIVVFKQTITFVYLYNTTSSFQTFDIVFVQNIST